MQDWFASPLATPRCLPMMRSSVPTRLAGCGVRFKTAAGRRSRLTGVESAGNTPTRRWERGVRQHPRMRV